MIVVQYSNRKQYFQKEQVKIGSAPDNDFVLNLGFEFLLTLTYNSEKDAFVLYNSSMDGVFSVSGKPLPKKALLKKGCAISIADSQEQLIIKISQQESVPEQVVAKAVQNQNTASLMDAVTNEIPLSASSQENPASHSIEQVVSETLQVNDSADEQLVYKPKKGSTGTLKTIFIVILAIVGFFARGYRSYLRHHPEKSKEVNQQINDKILGKKSVKNPIVVEATALEVAKYIESNAASEIPKPKLKTIINIIQNNAVFLGEKVNAEVNLSTRDSAELISFISGAGYVYAVELSYSQIPASYWQDIVKEAELALYDVAFEVIKTGEFDLKLYGEVMSNNSRDTFNRAIDNLVSENKITKDVAEQAKNVEGIKYFEDDE